MLVPWFFTAGFFCFLHRNYQSTTIYVDLENATCIPYKILLLCLTCKLNQGHLNEHISVHINHRFHQLPEFDQLKKSCRRRLAGHNERRRRPPPGPLASRYGRLAASFGGNKVALFISTLWCDCDQSFSFCNC